MNFKFLSDMKSTMAISAVIAGGIAFFWLVFGEEFKERAKERDQRSQSSEISN